LNERRATDNQKRAAAQSAAALFGFVPSYVSNLAMGGRV
jgi:hypothetical protein